MKLFRFGKKADFGEIFNEGLAHYQMGSLDEAVECFNRAIEIRTDVPEVYYQRGMAFARLGQLSRAIEDFKQVFNLGAPSRLKRDACYNLGKAYDELQQPEESIRWYDRTIKVDQGFANAYCNRGGVHLRLGEKTADRVEFELALADLNRGLALNPSDALAYFNRAIANKELQNDDQSNADLGKFMELAPSNHPYRLEVEKILAGSSAPASPKLEMMRMREMEELIQKVFKANNEKRYQEALKYCDEILEKDRRQPDVWDEKAFALMGMGKYKEALACCEEGIAVNPNAARLYDTRGNLLAHFKRYREAMGSFEKYLAIAPPAYAEMIPKVNAKIDELRRLINE